MFVSLLALVGGLVLLAVAADQFVVGAVRLTRALGIPALVVGVVVVGFGTSLPEMLVSGLAAGRGEMDVAVGNVVGSNVANLSLLLGVGALVHPVAVASRTVRREVPIVLGVTGLVAWVVQSGTSRPESLVLLVALAAALVPSLRLASASREADPLGPEVDEFGETPGHPSVRRAVAVTVAGLAGTLVASQLVLHGALDVADRLGLAAGFVGATIVAAGTSLPELVTVVQSARRREPDLIVGNLLGSNVFNATAVAGLAGLVAGPVALETRLTTTGVIAMLAVTVVAALLVRTGHRVTRWEGVVLVAAYAVTVVLLR